jgi:hypothetical protein
MSEKLLRRQFLSANYAFRPMTRSWEISPGRCVGMIRILKHHAKHRSIRIKMKTVSKTTNSHINAEKAPDGAVFKSSTSQRSRQKRKHFAKANVHPEAVKSSVQSQSGIGKTYRVPRSLGFRDLIPITYSHHPGAPRYRPLKSGTILIGFHTEGIALFGSILLASSDGRHFWNLLTETPAPPPKRYLPVLDSEVLIQGLLSNNRFYQN